MLVPQVLSIDHADSPSNTSILSQQSVNLCYCTPHTAASLVVFREVNLVGERPHPGKTAQRNTTYL